MDRRKINLKTIEAPVVEYIDSQLAETGLSDSQKEAVQGIAKVTGLEPLDLINDPDTFEGAIDQLYESLDHIELLEEINSIREVLGFTIKNPRVKFTKTELLPVNFKIRVKIPHPSKDLSFVTSIIQVTDESFWIIPAKVKGKTLDMSKIKNLEFRVHLSDGEYSFKSKLIEQTKQPIEAVIIQHTQQVEKLVIRSATRHRLSFKCKFSFITKSIKNSPDKSFAVSTTVEDISTDGIKFLAPQVPADVSVGDTVMFSLPEARLNKQVSANIVRLVPRNKGVNVHIQFQNLTEMDRLYVSKFIENELPKYRAKKSDKAD